MGREGGGGEGGALEREGMKRSHWASVLTPTAEAPAADPAHSLDGSCGRYMEGRKEGRKRLRAWCICLGFPSVTLLKPAFLGNGMEPRVCRSLTSVRSPAHTPRQQHLNITAPKPCKFLTLSFLNDWCEVERYPASSQCSGLDSAVGARRSAQAEVAPPADL